MLGYMTKEKAKQLGYTHEGTRCMVPVYATSGLFPNYRVKLPMLEIIIDLAEFTRQVFGARSISIKNIKEIV